MVIIYRHLVLVGTRTRSLAESNVINRGLPYPITERDNRTFFKSPAGRRPSNSPRKFLLTTNLKPFCCIWGPFLLAPSAVKVETAGYHPGIITLHVRKWNTQTSFPICSAVKTASSWAKTNNKLNGIGSWEVLHISLQGNTSGQVIPSSAPSDQRRISLETNSRSETDGIINQVAVRILGHLTEHPHTGGVLGFIL